MSGDNFFTRKHHTVLPASHLLQTNRVAAMALQAGRIMQEISGCLVDMEKRLSTKTYKMISGSTIRSER